MAILIAGVLLYIVNILIDNPYTHGFVNYYLNEKIITKLPIRAEYQSMKVSLLPPALNIYGVKVNTKPTPDQPTKEIIGASSLTFKVSLWSVFMAHPQIGDLEVTDLTTTWPPPKELMDALSTLGTSQTNRQDGPPIWPPRQAPPLSSLRISNASIKANLTGISINALQRADEITVVAMDGLNLDLEIFDWKSFKLALSAPKTTLSDSSNSYIETGNLSLRGELIDNKFRTRKLELKSSRLDFDGSAELEIVTRPKNQIIETIELAIASYQFKADSSIIGSFLDIPGNRGTIRGASKTNISIPVSAKKDLKFSTSGNLKSEDARFYDFRLYETESDFFVDLERFELNKTQLKIGTEVVATGSGSIGFGKAVPFDFKLTPNRLPFHDLLGLFNVNFDVVNFNLSSPALTIIGTGDPFQMKVESQAKLDSFATPTLDYDHGKFPSSPICDLDLRLNVDAKSLKIERGLGYCHHADRPERFALDVSGFTSFETSSGMSIVLSSNDFNPSPLSYFTQIGISGKGSMETRIHGPYDGVIVDVNWNTKDTIIGSTAIGDLNTSLRIADNTLTWSKLSSKFTGGGELISDSGSINFDKDLDLEFTAKASMIDHGVTRSAIADLSDGQSSLEFVARDINLNMKGPLLKPLKWQGTAKISLENIRDREYFYARSVTGTILGKATGYSSDDLEIAAGGTVANISFAHLWEKTTKDSEGMTNLGLSRTDRLETSGKLTAVPGAGDELRLIPIVGRLAAEHGISAQTSGDFKFSGTVSKLTGIARVKMSKAKITNNAVSDITASIVVDGTKLDIMAEQGGSALKARLSLDVGRDDLPFSWYITARNADFRPWLPKAMAQDARNYAYLTATWTLQGSMENWWGSIGELEIRDLKIRYYSPGPGNGDRYDFRSAHSSKILFKGNRWVLVDEKPIIISSAIGELKFGLRDHAPPSRIGILVDGRIDMGISRLISTDVETAIGAIKVEGGIFGSIENPNVDINLRHSTTESQRVDLGFSGFRPSFQNIEIDAALKYNGLYVKKLRASKGSGTISASGFVARPGSGDESDLTVNLDNAAFLYPFPVVRYFDSTLDGQIKISGSSRPWMASGRVKIRRARSNRDINIQDAILEALKSQSRGDITESITPSVNLDINISAEKSIAFSSRAIQAELSTDLRISGNNLTPSIIGLVEVSKGRFFHKRDFEIKRGLINFDDPIKPDPSLDISAVSDVASYRVSIGISGRASAPIVGITADPPTRPDGQALTEMEIIGLLSRGSLPSTQGGRNSSESAAAAEALNILAGQVEDTVQKIFDLSGQNVIRQVYIDTYAPEGGTPVARFNLPLNITDDFDVILKVDQSTLKVSSEYSLHDSISLTGGIESTNDKTNSAKSTGAPADTGVDLRFKFSFP